MDNLIGTPPNHALPHKYIDMEQMEYLCHLNRFSAKARGFCSDSCSNISTILQRHAGQHEFARLSGARSRMVAEARGGG